MIEYLTLCNAPNCSMASLCERKAADDVTPDTPRKDFSSEPGWVARDCAGYSPTRNTPFRAAPYLFRGRGL